MSSSILRHPLFSLGTNLAAIGGATYYVRSLLAQNDEKQEARKDFLYEEQEDRMDELEGTLRGHIGLIEDALDRIEGKEDKGKMDALYEKRGKDEKKK